MKIAPIIIILMFFNSCNVKQKDGPEEKFKIAVVKFRQVGLFENYKDLTDEQLTKLLIQKAKKKYQINGYNDFAEIFDTKNKYFDLYVAELDETRVWWKDLEADILNGNGVYLKTVEEFGKLSGGFLNPKNIKEEWITDKGPIRISFQDKDTLLVFNLNYEDDWYDVNFFKYLEQSMVNNKSPYRFYMHAQTGQDAFIIRLSESEKEMIEKKMDWKLEKF